MNCRRVENLIPLFVEGDLKPDAANQIASHLEWCGRCNWLADEYKDSQSWLRSNEPPEFDEAALNGLKAGILKGIEETGGRSSLLASLMHQWSRRQVFALSAAMLIAFGVVLFYIYQARMGVMPPVVKTAEQATDSESSPSLGSRQAPDTGTAPGAGLSGRHHQRRIASFEPRAGSTITAEKTVEPFSVSQMNRSQEPGTVSAEPTGANPGSANDYTEMLRIEIQTSDPNIRIIWFAPKEVESPQTNQ